MMKCYFSLAMALEPRRPTAVAGSWYSSDPRTLMRDVDRYLQAADAADSVGAGDVCALICPHAGLMYSGPVAAFAYHLLRGRTYDVVVLVGPSHYVGFEGVSVYGRGSFATPLGDLTVQETIASAITKSASSVADVPAAHRREHSLEMQLPFLARLLPDAPIVPLVMGYQTRSTVTDLSHALATVLSGVRALIVASSDLSHFHDAATAARLDGRVMKFVATFDPDGLMDALESFPEHACGGGPMVAVMHAAKALGARGARVLKYADSGDVSGDKSAVVGYLAAAFGSFETTTT
jgi:AmmeMemoRadiSam system protein B